MLKCPSVSELSMLPLTIERQVPNVTPESLKMENSPFNYQACPYRLTGYLIGLVIFMPY